MDCALNVYVFSLWLRRLLCCVYICVPDGHVSLKVSSSLFLCKVQLCCDGYAVFLFAVTHCKVYGLLSDYSNK